MPKIGIVAGEASGDLLASHLISAIRRQRPDVEFVGIAGPKMMAQGAKTLFPMERLSVRGYVEVIRHLPGLLKIRRALIEALIDQDIDLFVGVDAPDFNFEVERRLKQHQIPTVHYVSPSIWAWRKGRLKSIKRAVSHMLALFPFEPALYTHEGIPATFIGHPLADTLPLEPNRKLARERLRLSVNQTIVAMLPGSRQSEVQQLAALYVETAFKISEAIPNCIFLVPLITRETRAIFEAALHDFVLKHPESSLPIQILFGHAHLAMEASDLVIVASGTATLEAALIKRPMIITYKMPWFSWQILKRMNYLPYVGLPNILAGRFVVPELLQQDANPSVLSEKAVEMIRDKTQLTSIESTFVDIHLQLKQQAEEKAAQVVLSYLKS